MDLNTDNEVTSEALIRCLNDNIALLNVRLKRLSDFAAEGRSISDSDLKELIPVNDAANAARRILEIFENRGFNRPQTRERLLTAFDYLLDQPDTTRHTLKVYSVAIHALGGVS